MSQSFNSENYLLSEIPCYLSPGPDDFKLLFTGENYTYMQLFSFAGELADLFSRQDLSNTPVCLATSDKSTIIAAMLASLGGGPPLVIPYSLSDPVIAEACSAVGTKTILSSQPRRPPDGLQLLLAEPAISKSPVFSLSCDFKKPFVWLFTGGSTASPRIWSKSALNLFGEALYLKNKFKINNEDSFFATVSPLHIYGLLFSTLLPFMARSRVVNEIIYFPQEIVTSMKNYATTIFVSSPMHYKSLNSTIISALSLRKAFSSGGFLEESSSLYFHKQTGVGVTEVYGSTETGGVATRCRTKGESSWTPFGIVRWKIEQEHLCISSPFLSNDLPGDMEGFFMTGDRAQYDSNNTFVLLGRADSIVKVAGKRVDLKEVEDKIKTLAMVKDAYVFSMPSENGRENEVAALIVANSDKSRIRHALLQLLEPAAVPHLILIVDTIPVNAVGKPDKTAGIKLIIEKREKN
jgi:acyl-coenzyme A synthetase/AMP-(fatty) acid ligase